MFTPRECPNCYKSFETEYETKIYCSRYCKETARRRRKGVREFGVDYPNIYLKQCPNCATEYRTSRRDQVYCDRTCYEYFKEQKKRQSKSKMESGARRRYRNKVYIRNEGICQICKEYVYLNIKYPDPMSPSLDHIVPVSKGGTHALYNLQLTHLVCNVKRGNADI